MRGSDVMQERLSCYVTPEEFVPKVNPLRPILHALYGMCSERLLCE